MMPEVSIYHLMAIFRVFLLIIGQKQNFSVIASTKNGIDMKCHDSLKPLCVAEEDEKNIHTFFSTQKHNIFLHSLQILKMDFKFFV